MKYLLIIYQAVMSRAAGGGLFATRVPAFLPEIFFAVPIGVVFALNFSATAAAVIAGLLGAVWAYIWMQTGHGTAYHMGQYPQEAQGTRKQFLSPVVDKVCRWLNQPLGEGFYCWLFMGLKGVLIHAPLGLFSIPAAVLWPLAYYLGRRVFTRFVSADTGHSIAELLAGAFSGLLVALSL